MSIFSCVLCSSTSLTPFSTTTDDLSVSTGTRFKFLLFSILESHQEEGGVCLDCISILNQYDFSKEKLRNLKETAIIKFSKKFTNDEKKLIIKDPQKTNGNNHLDKETKDDVVPEYEQVYDPCTFKNKKKLKRKFGKSERCDDETIDFRLKSAEGFEGKTFTPAGRNRSSKRETKTTPLTEVEIAIVNADSLLRHCSVNKEGKETDGLSKLPEDVRDEINYALETLKKSFPSQILDFKASDEWDIKLFRMEHNLVNFGIKGETICFRCNKIFTDVSEKIEHKVKCQYNNSYKCPFCKKQGKTECGLVKHMREFHLEEFKASKFLGNERIGSDREPSYQSNEDYSFQCKFCGLLCKTELCYWHHYNLSHKKYRDRKCLLCQMNFTSMSYWRRHFLIEHSGFLYVCPFCSKTRVNHVDSIRSHLRRRCENLYPELQDPKVKRQKLFKGKKAFRKQIYECNICNSSHKGNLLYAKHMMTRHGLAVEMQCEFCEDKFKDVKELADHRKRFHVNHSCHVCARSFSTPTALQNHIKIVHEQDPEDLDTFMCEVCSRTFRKKEHLRVHMAKHSDEKNHKCSQCEASFKWSSSLTSHMQAKHATGKHVLRKCEFCDKTFTDLGNWRCHRYTHTQEKPHHCTYCNKGFIRRDMCQAHMKNCSTSDSNLS